MDIPIKNLADYYAMRRRDCREQGMLPALEYGVYGYDTVPAKQASYEFSRGRSGEHCTLDSGKKWK